MKAIKKLASGYTVENLREGILAAVIAWLVCIAAGGVYWWLLGCGEEVAIFMFTATAISGIEILINVALLLAKEEK